MTDIRTFDEIQTTDGQAVGGKGLSLGLLIQAGLPVPPGFCIVSDVHQRHRKNGIGPELRQTIASAYRHLGGRTGGGALLRHG